VARGVNSAPHWKRLAAATPASATIEDPVWSIFTRTSRLRHRLQSAGSSHSFCATELGYITGLKSEFDKRNSATARSLGSASSIQRSVWGCTPERLILEVWGGVIDVFVRGVCDPQQ